MNLAFKTELSFFEDCFAQTEEASLRILQSSTDIKKLEIVDFNAEEDLTYDHWVCSITVGLGEAQVFIKAHFGSASAREIASKELRLEDKKDMETSVLIDYMREYLNRVMGHIKGRYQSTDDTVSVPNITPSYDQGLSEPEENMDNANTRRWKVKWPGSQVVLTCYIVPTGDVTSIEANEDQEKDKVNFL
tara:strand:+ start:23 stop:592 length:570 start_codon:yes stop_codon:yes gene_type:complete